MLGIEWSRGKVRGKEGGSKGYAYVVKSLEWTTQGLNRTRKGVRADSVGGKERMERPEAPWCPTAAATAWAGERCADNGGSRQLLAALFHRVSGGLRKTERGEGGEWWSSTQKIVALGGTHIQPVSTTPWWSAGFSSLFLSRSPPRPGNLVDHSKSRERLHRDIVCSCVSPPHSLGPLHISSRKSPSGDRDGWKESGGENGERLHFGNAFCGCLSGFPCNKGDR